MLKNKYEFHLMQHDALPVLLRRAVSWPNKNRLTNWHENLELIHIIRGSASVQYNGKLLSLDMGDILVINANVLHSLFGSDDLLYHWMVADKHFCETNGIHTSSLYFQEIIHDEKLNEKFLKTLEAFDEFKETAPVYGTASVRVCTLDLLCYLCRNYLCADESHGDSLASLYVKAAIRYISINYSKPLSLDQIAEHVGISKYYLCREFKLLTGRTIFEIIRVIRCKEARRMIEQGSSINEAALACGFETSSYFTKSFKKCFRELPSKYIPK